MVKTRRGKIVGTGAILELVNEHVAASVLGLQVSTLRRWRWAGVPDLPFYKIGRAVRYSLNDLQDFVQAGYRNSTSDDGVALTSHRDGQGR